MPKRQHIGSWCHMVACTRLWWTQKAAKQKTETASNSHPRSVICLCFGFRLAAAAATHQLASSRLYRVPFAQLTSGLTNEKVLLRWSIAMSHKDAERKLTEDDCLTSSQQYDPQLIFHVPLRRKGYQAIDASAFIRCGGLRVVDISGNRLSTLSGLESVAPQLTFLNAAENSLHDISALVTCAALERCMLEGNKLASVDSLQPLVSLPCLAVLVLQRHVPLDDADIGLGSPQQSSDKLLLLDNPVCRDAVAYREHFLARVSHVRWVDGVSTYLRASSLAESTTTESHDATENSTKAIVDAAIRSFQSIRVQMTATVSEETTLRHQLERAADRCKPSTVTVAARTP